TGRGRRGEKRGESSEQTSRWTRRIGSEQSAGATAPAGLIPGARMSVPPAARGDAGPLRQFGRSRSEPLREAGVTVEADRACDSGRGRWDGHQRRTSGPQARRPATGFFLNPPGEDREPAASPRLQGESAAGTDPYLKGLILAQNERWRRGLGMQVERAR